MTDPPDRTADTDFDVEDVPLEVRSEPVEAEDGSTVVIAQQNAGPGNQVGDGEFKRGETGRTVKQAAEEQAELGQDAPIEDSGASRTMAPDPGARREAEENEATEESGTPVPSGVDPMAPGRLLVDPDLGDAVEPNEPA
jgi:hypothetical protein